MPCSCTPSGRRRAARGAALLVLALAAFLPRAAHARGGPPGPVPPAGPEPISPAWQWLSENEQPPADVKWAPDLTDRERLALEARLASTLALAITRAEDRPTDRDVGGSAFLVREDGVLVTNWHILSMVGEGQWLWARVPGGEWTRAMPLGATWWADVGVARLPPMGDRWQPVEWGEAEPGRLGRRFFCVGSPMGRPHVASGGRLTSLAYFDPREEDGRREIRARRVRPRAEASLIGLHFSDDLSMPGGSGSPVFDEDGACVGIVSAGDASRPRDERAFVRPAALLRPLVDMIAENAYFDPPDLGVRLGPPPTPPGMPTRLPRALETARRRVRGGALVERIRPRGPAHGVLRESDVVLEIGGRPVFGEVYESRALALLALEADRPAEVLVLRGGRRRTVSVTPRRGREIYEDFDGEHRARAPALGMPGGR